MAGPAGQIVGRVNIRVAPDTSKFAREMRAQLREIKDDFKVEVDLNVAQAKAKFETLRKSIQEKPIEIGVKAKNATGVTKTVQQVRQKAKANPIDIPLSVDIFGARAELAAFRRAAGKRFINIPVRVEPKGIAGTQGWIEPIWKTAVETGTDSIKALSSMLGGLSGVAEDTFSTMSKTGSKAFGFLRKKGRSAWAAVTAGALKAVGVIFQVTGAITGVLAILGTVQSIVGGISAGLAGLPVLFSTIGLSIATVALGMDTLKKGFKSLKTEVNILKQAVGQVFQKQLLNKVLPGIRNMLKELKGSFKGIASGLSDMGVQISEVFTNTKGLKRTKRMFEGVESAIRRMTPGIKDFVRESARIAGSTELYKILGDTINGITLQFSDFLSKIRETGLLKGTLQALKPVLVSIADLFTDWATEGMRFVKNAAPGIDKFIRGFGEFLNGFDWEFLGTQFGRVMGAFGKALKGVDTKVFSQSIKRFADSLVNLANSGAIQLLVDLFTTMINGASTIMNVTSFFAELFNMGNPAKPFRVMQSNLEKFNISAGKTPSIGNAALKVIRNLGNISRMTGKKVKGAAFKIAKHLASAARKGGRSANRLAQRLASAGTEGRRQILREIRRVAPGILAAGGNMNDVARRVMNNLQGELDNGANGYSSGKAIGNGLAAGLDATMGNIISSANAAVQAIADRLPNSPAKVGPFSGTGWTPHRGRALVAGFAQGIAGSAYLAESATDSMIGRVDSAIDGYAKNGGMAADIRAAVTGDDFGDATRDSVFEGVMAAFDGSKLQIDGQGVTKIVNKENAKNTRR